MEPIHAPLGGWPISGFDMLTHVSCLLALVSFWVRDILWLRVLSIGSSLVWLGAMFIFGPVFGASVFWNLVFISINSWRSAQLILESRAVDFTGEEAEMYRTVFAKFKPVEFNRLLRAGRWRSEADGVALLIEGEEPCGICLLTAGKLMVEKAGREVASLSPFEFVGEMGYLTGERSSATVRSVGQVRFFHWDRAKLAGIFAREPSLQFAFQSLLTADLSKKLRRATG
jgi:hypothetical protein